MTSTYYASRKNQIAQRAHMLAPYAETHVGYHADNRIPHGSLVYRHGCYAELAAPYGGSIRIYAASYDELAKALEEYAQDVLGR